MENREEDRALDVEAEPAPAERGAQHLVASGGPPEPVKHQAGADAPTLGPGLPRAAAVLGQRDDLLREAAGGADEAVEGAGGEQALDPAEAGDDALAGLAALAAVLAICR